MGEFVSQEEGEEVSRGARHGKNPRLVLRPIQGDLTRRGLVILHGAVTLHPMESELRLDPGKRRRCVFLLRGRQWVSNSELCWTSVGEGCGEKERQRDGGGKSDGEEAAT